MVKNMVVTICTSRHWSLIDMMQEKNQTKTRWPTSGVCLRFAFLQVTGIAYPVKSVGALDLPLFFANGRRKKKERKKKKQPSPCRVGLDPSPPRLLNPLKLHDQLGSIVARFFYKLPFFTLSQMGVKLVKSPKNGNAAVLLRRPVSVCTISSLPLLHRLYSSTRQLGRVK